MMNNMHNNTKFLPAENDSTYRLCISSVREFSKKIVLILAFDIVYNINLQLVLLTMNIIATDTGIFLGKCQDNS